MIIDLSFLIIPNNIHVSYDVILPYMIYANIYDVYWENHTHVALLGLIMVINLSCNSLEFIDIKHRLFIISFLVTSLIQAPIQCLACYFTLRDICEFCYYKV